MAIFLFAGRKTGVGDNKESTGYNLLRIPCFLI